MFGFFKNLLNKTENANIMRLLKKQKTEDKPMTIKDHVVRYVLLFLTLLFIVYNLPNPNTASYHYSEGDIWHYEDLHSKYDFPVQLNDSVLKVKQDSVKREIKPVLVRNDVKVGNDKVEAIINGFRQSDNIWNRSGRVNAYIRELKTKHSDLQKRGVLTKEAYDSLLAGGYKKVCVQTKEDVKPVSLSELSTTESVIQQLKSYNEEATDSGIIKIREYLFDEQNIGQYIQANLLYPDSLKKKADTEFQFKKDSLSKIVERVSVDQCLIRKGERVTPKKMELLQRYESIMEENNSQSRPFTMVIGQILIILTVLLILNSFLQIFRPDYTRSLRTFIMLFLLLAVFSWITATLVQYRILHVLIIPFCMLPIIVRVFLDSRTAFIFHVGTIIIASISLTYPYMFIVTQTIAGLVAIQSLKELNQRSQLVRTMVMIVIVTAIIQFAFQLINTTNFTISDISNSQYVYILISGLLLLLTYPMFWIFEKFFGFTSEMTLVELSNTNNELLQKLTEEAPGTFQHSMQVATLASEVAKRIHANVQLVRTGALYHDIGKLARPAFFTENQSGINPHTRITPVQSATVIIEHVIAGLQLAEHYNLPKAIKRFIQTHHGCGKVKYFYITYKNEHPDEKIDESIFTYPGPNPETKEEAILMMADSVEAASRSLPEYTEENISTLVDKIVDGQVAEQFFKDCDITFKEIQTAKTAMKDRLKTMYHTRITYPELDKKH